MPNTLSGSATFVYDGDGNRVKKTEGGQTILYVNKYFEKNLSTNTTTAYYYFGDKLVAKGTSCSTQILGHYFLPSYIADSLRARGVWGNKWMETRFISDWAKLK